MLRMLRGGNNKPVYALAGCARRLQSRLFTSLHISEEVEEALRTNKPVVALESTIISHGMPYPENIKVAREVEDICRDAGAIPATVAVINGFPKVGLHASDFEVLGQADKNKVKKCSQRDLPLVCATGQNAATTVAGTMYLAHLAGVRVFATGGIGGVHRDLMKSFDISADLVALSKIPVAVVCAGIKSILDIPNSVEYLETMGVPVIGMNCDEFPAFFHNNSGVKCPSRLNTPLEVARVIASMEELKMNTGTVIAVPNPAPADAAMVDGAIEQAVREAHEQGIQGWRITPFLLARVNELTKGSSLISNVQLVKNNAKTATDIAVELANVSPRHIGKTNDKSTVSAYSSASSSSPSPSRLQQQKEAVKDASTSTQSSHTPSRGGRPQVIIVGGAVVDLTTRPSEGLPLLAGTSNPGVLLQTYGGVGRNIAEAATRLGCRTSLVSVVADDAMGKSLLNHSNEVGINTNFLRVLPSEDGKHRTATYSAVLDPAGELHVAIADMRILSHVSPEDIRDVATHVQDADFVVTDGNLEKKTFAAIASLCRTYNIPLMFEPTSVPKSILPVHRDTIGAIDFTKPNEKELVAMVKECYQQGLLLENLSQVDQVLKSYEKTSSVEMKDVRLLGTALARTMLKHSDSAVSAVDKRKVHGKHVLVTLGKNGVVWIGPTEVVGQKFAIDDQFAITHIPATKTDVVSCTGAGDTFMGALIWGLVHNKSMRASIIAGMEAAKLTIGSHWSVSPDLSVDAVEQGVKTHFKHYRNE